MALDFQRLFESAPSLYLVLDRDFRIVAVTDAYLTATMTSRGIMRARIREAGFNVFREKPIDPVDLAYEVERLANSRGSES